MSPNAAAYSRPRPTYGYDAPGIMSGLLGSGAALMIVAAIAVRWAWRDGGWLAVGAFGLLLAAGVVPLFFGSLMVAYGLAGKTRMRDLIIGSVGWTGREHVLDVGTGAGLLLIGAAKRLSEGRAVGVGIWSAKDLSDNARETTERNIRIEGVEDRVTIETADARALPMANESFDRVLSLLCLHNIEDKAGKLQACRQIARVLKPGGVALIADYLPTNRYAAAFRDAGLSVVSSRAYFGTALSLMWMVRAEKPAVPTLSNATIADA